MAFRPSTTIEEDQKRAEVMMAAGFSTVADQKRALDAVANAFQKINNRLKDFILSQDKNAAYDEAYWNAPSYIHQFKQNKHGAWYSWVNRRDNREKSQT